MPNIKTEEPLFARDAESTLIYVLVLEQLSIPALVIHGDYDFIPVECAARIAQAIPGARFVLLRDCGHFSYLERLDEVRKELADFF